MNDIIETQPQNIETITPNQIAPIAGHELGVVVLSNRRLNLPSASTGEDVINVAKELDKPKHKLFSVQPSAFVQREVPTTWGIAKQSSVTSDLRLAICFTTASNHEGMGLANKIKTAARAQYCPIEQSSAHRWHVITGVLNREDVPLLSGDDGVFPESVKRIAFCLLDHGILNENIAIGSNQNPFAIAYAGNGQHLQKT